MVMQILLEKACPLALVAAVAVEIFAYPNSSIAEARYSANAGVNFVFEFVRPEEADLSFVEYSVSSQITSSGAEFAGTGTATIDLNKRYFGATLVTQGSLVNIGSVSSFANAKVFLTIYNPTDIDMELIFRVAESAYVQSYSDANEAGSAASSTKNISLESIFGSEQPYWEDLGDEFGGVSQSEDGSWGNSYYKSDYFSFFVAANSSASVSYPLHVEGKLNSTVEQLSFIEAESMALSGGYAVEENTAASGGQLIRRLVSGGQPATASTQYTGPAGVYDIAVSYFDESDGDSSLACVLNGQPLDQWIADENPACRDCASPGASTLRTRIVARDVSLSPGDEISLQGTGDYYEYARFDKITIAPVSSSTLEAEMMTLEGGYAVEDNAAASGGQLIRRLVSGGYAATASTEFTGLAGAYDITVSYFDESDGISSLAFLLNGEMLDQWIADEDPSCRDCASPGASTLRTRVVAKELRLAPGDEIALQGTGEHYEYARFDKITLAPVGFTTLEAELMTLDDGFVVEANTAASGGQIIRGNGPADSVPGKASAAFMGSQGTYDITVTYFDEYDGISSMAFFLNGQLLHRWLADENPACRDCASPNESTLRTRVVATGIEISPGDDIRLESTVNQYEYGRFDKIDFTLSLSP
jgi:hypothetical protein